VAGGVRVEDGREVGAQAVASWHEPPTYRLACPLALLQLLPWSELDTPACRERGEVGRTIGGEDAPQRAGPPPPDPVGAFRPHATRSSEGAVDGACCASAMPPGLNPMAMGQVCMDTWAHAFVFIGLCYACAFHALRVHPHGHLHGGV
jgi:hypothetical protein